MTSVVARQLFQHFTTIFINLNTTLSINTPASQEPVDLKDTKHVRTVKNELLRVTITENFVFKISSRNVKP